MVFRMVTDKKQLSSNVPSQAFMLPTLMEGTLLLSAL